MHARQHDHWEVVFLRRSITAAVALLALATVADTALGADGIQGRQQIQAPRHEEAQTIGRAALAYYGGEISRFQKQTWHWQRLMGAPLSPRAGRMLAELSPSAIQRAAAQWRQRSARAYKSAQHPPHLSQFLCIHHYEGSWTDTGAPYYGGLQMDRTFQRSYGGWLYARKGTADHWAPIEQIWVAENALKSRGFWPWPNTARFCGLI
jgi:Transglycosylase-like domain